MPLAGERPFDTSSNGGIVDEILVDTFHSITDYRERP
jgi:hypothetical protein